MSSSGYLKFDDQSIHCVKYGSGKELMIAFHGFYNDAGMFASWLPYLDNKYTICAVDLPGHGKTEWNKDLFLLSDLMMIVNSIKQSFGAKTFTLLGYSLGARMALNIVQNSGDWVNKLILIAPDGLSPNLWYTLATKNFLGRRIFNKITSEPEVFYKYFKKLNDWKIIDDSIFKFASSNINNNEIRIKLQKTWPLLRKLIPQPLKVKFSIIDNKINVLLISGEYDRIFPPKKNKKFIKSINTAQHIILKTGHNINTKNQVQLITHAIIEWEKKL